DCCGACERHSVPENRVAERERREGCKRVAADVGAYMGRTKLALHQLDGREDWSFWTSCAESRWARGQRAECGGSCSFVSEQPARGFRYCVGINAFRPCFLEKCREAFEQYIGGVFTGVRQQPFAKHPGIDVRPAQLDVDGLLDIVGIAFLDNEHGALAGAEFPQFFR